MYIMSQSPLSYFRIDTLSPSASTPTAEVNHHSVPPVVLLPTSIVPDTSELFTYKIASLTPTIRVIQGSIQELIVRVDTSQIKEAS